MAKSQSGRQSGNPDMQLTRRRFLTNTVAGGALCLGVAARGKSETSPRVELAAQEGPRDVALNAWVRIDTAGKVILTTHKAEMGQGVYQALPQILAEELEVDLAQVEVVFAPGDRATYGSQVTGGSSSVRTNYEKLLALGATARVMLTRAAADRWRVPVAECVAEAGVVLHPESGRQAHYGELVEAASLLPVPDDVPLKKRADYRLIGRPLPRLDIPDKVRGRTMFGMDKRLDGLRFAVVARSPRLHGSVLRVDDTAARAVPGVEHIVRVRMGVHQMYREGVAVVATSTWAAMKGRDALVVEWDDTGFEYLDTDTIFEQQRELLASEEGFTLTEKGEPERVLDAAGSKLDVIYRTPYQAHSCLEPLNCTARFSDGRLEIWGPIQAPEWVQDYIAEEMGIAHENIIVNETFLGGGFGRKAFMDYPHEAAQIARATGVPVQVVWTREDDTTQGPFRPGASYRCEGVVENGRIAAMKVRLVAQNKDHQRFGDARRGSANRSAGEGLAEPYLEAIDHVRLADVPFERDLPIMWWRAVYASTNGFAYESFIDELAHAVGADPLAFRRAHLPTPRLQALIDTLERVSGWQGRQRGYGVAITECFKTTVGQVVKVSRGADGRIRVDQVWAVVDCGWHVNPDTIRAQVEGSILMALGAAVTHEITLRGGLVEQANFDSYPMPRLADMPPVEVHIMNNEAPAGGVGEPGLPPFAPALANAIFDLTGQRIRELPVRLDALGQV